MKYSIGKKVDFLWDNYDYYYNTDLVYEGTERLSGVIKSYNEQKNVYGIMVGETLYTVWEDDIIDKAAEFKHKLTDMKVRIANAALKMRDALYGCSHPAHYEESSKEYEKCKEELFDLMSEYNDKEDEYIMLGGDKKTY